MVHVSHLFLALLLLLNGLGFITTPAAHVIGGSKTESSGGFNPLDRPAPPREVLGHGTSPGPSPCCPPVHPRDPGAP